MRGVVRRIRRGLADLFSLPDGYEVLIGNGGSTLFWDAAAFGLIEKRSTHLVIGEFSSKFAAVTRAAPHLDDPQVCETAPGLRPELPDHVDGDVYAYPHNETSTGVMIPVHRPDRSDALVVVDGTSGASGMRVDATAFDVYYFAPQKCFASDGGLWLALCSPRAIERIERLHASDRWIPASLDLVDRGRELAPRPDVQHARARDDLPARPPAPVDARQRRTRVRGGPVRHVGRHRLRLGRAPRARDAVRRRRGRAQPRDRDDRLRRHGRRVGGGGRAPRQRRRSTSNRTESWAATSCGSRCSRRSTRRRRAPHPRDRLRHRSASALAQLRVSTRVMLLLHEVHTVAGRHEDEFEGRVPRRLDADARQGRRRAPPLLPAPRARHRPGVPHGHDHGAARRRRVRTARDARAARRPAQLGVRSRPAAPRGAGQAAAARRLVTDAGSRSHDRADRRPRARRRALHGRQRVAARVDARHATSTRRARTTRRASKSAPNGRC